MTMEMLYAIHADEKKIFVSIKQELVFVYIILCYHIVKSSNGIQLKALLLTNILILLQCAYT